MTKERLKHYDEGDYLSQLGAMVRLCSRRVRRFGFGLVLLGPEPAPVMMAKLRRGGALARGSRLQWLLSAYCDRRVYMVCFPVLDPEQPLMVWPIGEEWADGFVARYLETAAKLPFGFTTMEGWGDAGLLLPTHNFAGEWEQDETV